MNAEKFKQLNGARISGDAWLEMYFPSTPAPAPPMVVVDGDFRPVICMPTPETDPAEFAMEMALR